MMYPNFNVHEVKEANGTIMVSGSLNRTAQGREKWIDDGWIGCLMKGSIVAFGRWFKKTGNIWEFRFDKKEMNKLKLTPNEDVEALDGYWGERAEITLDNSIEWKESIFKTKGNWNHEHCSICWETISEHENRKYFLGNGQYPVCIECYQNYIQSHNLSFIPKH